MKSREYQAFTKKAVALEYDTNALQGTPKVIASGKNEVAKQIIAKAKEFDVPIFENKELANTLLGVELNQEIPPELYKAVSEVFVWLMKSEKS